MRGTLFVTNDLKAFLANPQQVIKITEWKLADFTEDLKRVSQQHNFRGKMLFTTLACAQCHKLNKDAMATAAVDHGHGHGAGHGHAMPSIAVGPQLDDVVKKYRGDAKAVLLEILEPSRTIKEKYRTVSLQLDNGKLVSGNVIAEDKESVTLYTPVPIPKEQKVLKSSIEARQPSVVSIMPVGLLNTLDKEQVLDLVAYLLAGGDAKRGFQTGSLIKNPA